MKLSATISPGGFFWRHPSWLIIGLLATTMAVLVPVEQHRLHTARGLASAESLRAGNLLAQRDSTRDVALSNARVARLLGDSLRLVQKRVQQVVQTRDQLDRALGGERRARYTLAATVDSLRASTSAPAVTDTSGVVRRAQFNIRRPPYPVAASVAIPPPPDSARMALNVSLDPIPIGARVLCTGPDPQGVRTASLAVSAPPWATVQLGTLEQSPELCMPPAVRRASPRAVQFHPLIVGVGVTGRAGGRLSWGWFVGTGLSISI